MKYRIRMDISFDDESTAKSLFETVKKSSSKASSINEGKPSQEISYIEYEICGHDEGKECQTIEKIEIRNIKISGVAE